MFFFVLTMRASIIHSIETLKIFETKPIRQEFHVSQMHINSSESCINHLNIYPFEFIIDNYSKHSMAIYTNAPQDLYSKFKQWCQDRLPQKHHRNRNPDDPFK
ncbi:hypothetical protein DERP_012564 [Dermatophagoides pteronyssinus]|uniref:Uncharacterized protein n=1 Tax=Dermatophagoides pteronyssinus TaxID=6956 RepID=A0ABQ8IUT6_DERPT|nr:hypothetical protein DERP_012564 [Dermatophagoides pteronyssinus]